MESVRKVEKKLELIGEDKTWRLLWTDLLSFVKQMGYKATTKDNKVVLFGKLKEHMVKEKLWKVSKTKEVSKRKGCQRRKPIGQRVEGDRVRK